MTDLVRIKQLAGILNESVSHAKKVNGLWTDGTYTHGDPVVVNGQGMNLEYDPESGSWWAIGDDGDEIEFEPGMEDRHDPEYNPYVRESELEEAGYNIGHTEEYIRKSMDRVKNMAENIEGLVTKNGNLDRAINEVGGEPSALKELRQAAEDLYRAAEEAEYYALVHLDRD